MSGGVGVEISGRRRTIRYTFNSLAALERESECGIERALGDERAGFRQVRTLVWAGLLHESPELTPTAVGDLLEQHVEAGGSLIEVFRLCTTALAQSTTARALGVAAGEGATPAPLAPAAPAASG